MEEFDWKEAKYPCLGIADNGEIVCFSAYKIGHLVSRSDIADRIGYYSRGWGMDSFKPYTKPEERIKLWFWEYKNRAENNWCMYTRRLSEKEAKKFNNKTFRKLVALGFI